METNDEKIKVVKTQSFIKEPELHESLNEVRVIGSVLNGWVNRNPQDRAALVIALEGDKLCFYRMLYTDEFAECNNPDLAFAMHMGCAMIGSSSLYAALKTGLKFCDECMESYEKESDHGTDSL